MAIVKTSFTGITKETNYAEVLAYLQANATGYFDTVIGDETALTVTCKVGDVTAVVLDFFGTGSYIISIYLKNGSQITPYIGSTNGAFWNTSCRFDYAKKTSYGIFLHTNNPTNLNLFISKNNVGGLVCALIYPTDSNYGKFALGDFENSTDFTISNTFSRSASSWATAIYTCGVLPAGRTALTPLCFDSGTYCEHLFFVPFSQLKGSICDIDFEGKKYVYNSFFALEE